MASNGLVGDSCSPAAVVETGQWFTSRAVAKAADVLLCMYSGPPEAPTLNAITVIGSYFRSVTFLRNNLDCPAESYPIMPKLVEIGASCDVQTAQTKGNLWKLFRFIRYCWAMHKHLRNEGYGLVVLHDYLALLAFWLVRRSAGYNGLVWFNSYDVIDPKHVPFGKLSLMRLVIIKHESLFAALDFFSLPAVERRPYYPIQKVKLDCFVIPNYPAIAFFARFNRPKRIGSEIKLIYQGALGKGHGFENLIRFLRFNVRGKPLRLVLKGWIVEDYRVELVRLAAQCGVSDKLSFAGFGSYQTVPELASTSTIGVAIFTGRDIMNQTLGTASNKIYEYAALGLPVILFDLPHFRHYLARRKWAFFTDLSEASLNETIEHIVGRYEEASHAAVHDFLEELNFERVFTPALHKIIESMSEQHARI